MHLKIVPEAMIIRTSGVIINEVVIGESNPEAGWFLISVEETKRFNCADDQIFSYEVVRFNRILNKDSMSFDSESNIFYQSQVIRSWIVKALLKL